MTVELEAQVVGFVRSLAPEPRKAVRRALAKLEQEKGDIRPLEGELENYYRLRVLRYRIVFHYTAAGRKRLIRCVYAAPRSIVYEVFAQQIRDLLR
jgi:mRNA interferase RelE/StbE